MSEEWQRRPDTGPYSIWQRSVITEKQELDAKLGKLEKFLAGKEFAAIDPMERERLKAQYRVMRWYSEILTDRIESFQV